MSKNLTRKGLAFGAIVALGASLFSAAPAFAADELTLAPTTGTLYKTIEGETFSLSAGLAPATPAGNTVQLKYQVVTASTVTVKVNGLLAAAAADTPVAGQTTKITVGQATNTAVYKEDATPTVGAAQTLKLTASTVASGTPVTAAVTAFFDANANNILDSGEFASAARTVTWVDAADVVANITIGALTAGDTTATATLSFKDINNSQIPKAHVGMFFTQNDASASTLAGLTTGLGTDTILSTGASALTYSSTKDVFSATTGTFTAVNVTAGSLVNSTLKVKALYNVAGDGSTAPLATEVVGTAATLDAVARTINSIEATASGTTGVKEGAAVKAVPGTAGSLAVDASNVKDQVVTVVATVKDNASTPAVVANAAFKVTVAGTQVLGTANSISINGTAYTAALTSALDATTDASGKLTFAIKNVTALTAGGTVTLAIAGQNITNTVTINYAAPVYTIIDTNDVAGSAGRTILKATAYALSYKVLDQFGDAPAVASSTSAYRLVDVVTTTNIGTYYANVAADGTATLSFATAATAGNTVHTVQVQKSADSFANFTYLDDGAGCTAATGVGCAALATTVVVKATAAEATAKTVTLGNPVPGAGQASTTFAANVQTGKANLSEAAFAAFDGRTAKTAAPALGKGYSTAPSMNTTTNVWTAGTPAAVGGAKISIAVSVKDSTVAATAIDGASVTVTGKGLLFVAGSVMGVDSLTFLADSGTTTVDVYSHVTGEQSIVFTSGAATSTQKITFTNYGTEVAAVALGTLAAQAQAGSTLSLSAVATDKWGNVVPNVSVAFSNTGAGYVQDVAAQLTDSTGKVSGRLIVLQNDLGTSYITATAAKAKTLLSADLASAKSVEFGLVDADVVAGGHRVFVNAEFAKGRTITVTIDGKRVYSKVQATDNAVELAFTQKKKGSHTVTVRISGGVVFTEKVTTN